MHLFPSCSVANISLCIKRAGHTGTGGEVAFQEMLAPALAALSEDDRVYSAEVATGESFEDMIDLFAASFTVTEDISLIRDSEG